MIFLAAAPALIKVEMLMPVKSIYRIRKSYPDDVLYPVRTLASLPKISGSDVLIGSEESMLITWMTKDQIKALRTPWIEKMQSG